MTTTMTTTTATETAADRTLANDPGPGADGKEAPAPTPLAKRLNSLIILAAMGLLLNGFYDHTTSPVQARLLDSGDRIPNYNLELVNGGVATPESFAGKPALYYFYANWCPCSHESVGMIRGAVEKGRADGLSAFFVGIQDSEENLVLFAKKHDLEFPVSARGGQSLADMVGISVTPTTVFVDKEGVIRSFFVGKVEKFEQLEEGLSQILSGPPAQV